MPRQREPNRKCEGVCNCRGEGEKRGKGKAKNPMENRRPKSKPNSEDSPTPDEGGAAWWIMPLGGSRSRPPQYRKRRTPFDRRWKIGYFRRLRNKHLGTKGRSIKTKGLEGKKNQISRWGRFMWFSQRELRNVRKDNFL